MNKLFRFFSPSMRHNSGIANLSGTIRELADWQIRFFQYTGTDLFDEPVLTNMQRYFCKITADNALKFVRGDFGLYRKKELIHKLSIHLASLMVVQNLLQDTYAWQKITKTAYCDYFSEHIRLVKKANALIEQFPPQFTDNVEMVFLSSLADADSE